MNLRPFVIVCRPVEKAKELAQLLEINLIDASILPLIDIVKGKHVEGIFEHLAFLPNNSPVFLLSPNIFKYIQHASNKDSKTTRWRCDLNYFAIGASTAKAFKQISGLNAYHPSGDEISETMIKLPELNQIIQETDLNDRQVAILRGNGGRDVISSFMKTNNYIVSEYEMYKREPIDVTNTIDWQNILNHEIIFVVTSGEILALLNDKLKKNIPKLTTFYEQANLVVVSERIKKIASEIGWQKISIAQSANNMSLFEKIKEIIECEKKQENYPY